MSLRAIFFDDKQDACATLLGLICVAARPFVFGLIALGRRDETGNIWVRTSEVPRNSRGLLEAGNALKVSDDLRISRMSRKKVIDAL